MEHDDMDLRGRASPPDDPAFARRILDAAFAQSRPLCWRDRWNAFRADLREDFMIPRPAMAFGVIALVGFLVGAALETEPSNDAITISSLFYDTGEMI